MFYSTMPIYLNYANSIEDPMERMKCVIASQMAFALYENTFQKPLNPILGETYQCEGPDGAKLYFEQTSHHPPVTHFLIEQPDGNYKVNGWFDYSISSGPMTAKCTSSGYKIITFADGGKIKYSHN